MDVCVLEKSSPCYLETEAHNKPQSGFQHVLADNSYNQFKHLMLPHEVGGDSENVHPYKEEIGELLKNLKTEFVELFDGEVTRIEDTECVWVETTSQLEDLVKMLSKERVFGVDTEHHGFRSFLGFTALIQISTTSKDYLVDTIALHDVMGILRPVFANPHICKVFHGAGSDILWLQRDFHIYVVNLFDTAKASQVLWKQPKSFAYLLEKYCGVLKNKALQTGDWRPRPLSAEMVQYARTDSHYLLPVANCLVSELKSYSIDMVIDTIRRSNVLCLELYKKDTKEAHLGESAAASIISRYLKNHGSFHYNVCDTKLCCSCLSKFQRIVRRLFVWRDIMARVHDESLSFILSDRAIGAIASTLPTIETDIHSTICTADSSMSPSPVVCSHFEDFGKIMFPDSATEDDEFGHTILQWHLGSIGNCPLSMYNYNLLSDTIPKLSNRLVLNPNGSRARYIVLGNDGRFLRRCTPKVIKSYISLGIAELVVDDPPTIKLLCKFKDEDERNDQQKCAGCGGEGNNLLHYEIIPPCYLRWFPGGLRGYQEVKLLCVDCYAIVNVAAMECKRQIAKEFGILLEVDFASDLRAVATALLLNGGRLPANRFEELTKTVDMYYGEREVTNEDLEQAVDGLRRRLKKKSGFKRLKKVATSGLSHSKQQVECSKKDGVDDDISATSENPKGEALAFSSHSGTSKSESCSLDHGKLVVNYLFETARSDGILQFCSRWTQVFNNALHLA